MTIARLASEKCKPCETTALMSREQARIMLSVLPGWNLKSRTIEKEFRFKSYLAGLNFASSLGKTAEEEDHHPDMLVGWRRVKVTLSTHAIKGLSRNDFIMAAKAEVEFDRIVNTSDVRTSRASSATT